MFKCILFKTLQPTYWIPFLKEDNLFYIAKEMALFIQLKIAKSFIFLHKNRYYGVQTEALEGGSYIECAHDLGFSFGNSFDLSFSFYLTNQFTSRRFHV